MLGHLRLVFEKCEPLINFDTRIVRATKCRHLTNSVEKGSRRFLGSWCCHDASIKPRIWPPETGDLASGLIILSDRIVFVSSKRANAAVGLAQIEIDVANTAGSCIVRPAPTRDDA